MEFKYLVSATVQWWKFIRSSGQLKFINAQRQIGCLNQTVWKNKYLNKGTKKIYKSKTSNSYAMETLPATTGTEEKIQKTEMQEYVRKPEVISTKTRDKSAICRILKNGSRDRRRQCKDHTRLMDNE